MKEGERAWCSCLCSVWNRLTVKTSHAYRITPSRVETFFVLDRVTFPSPFLLRDWGMEIIALSSYVQALGPGRRYQTLDQVHITTSDVSEVRLDHQLVQ